MVNNRSELALNRKGLSHVAGVDEAGRGPLAGPVVAAACILPKGISFEGLNDSKQLTAKQRDRLFTELTNTPLLHYAIGIVDVETIDQINILQAALLAMKQAVLALAVQPDYLLIDGNQRIATSIPQETLIGGDARSVSIAAASVLAKVTRDRLMEQYHQQYPQYGFAKHKGYGTAAHLAALIEHGPCAIHRRTFAPIYSLTKEPFLT